MVCGGITEGHCSDCKQDYKAPYMFMQCENPQKDWVALANSLTQSRERKGKKGLRPITRGIDCCQSGETLLCDPLPRCCCAASCWAAEREFQARGSGWKTR